MQSVPDFQQEAPVHASVPLFPPQESFIAVPDPSLKLNSETIFNPIELLSEPEKTWDFAIVAFPVAPFIETIIMPARIPTIAITTNSSIRVNDFISLQEKLLKFLCFIFIYYI